METKKRILLVDDEQINLEFFEVMLSNLGFDIFIAEDGQAALESIRRLRPDLVILDNVMPKLSGWEVTRTIKSSPEYSDFANTPIIMLSAMDDIKDKVEGLELGADDYITKPFNFAEVLARIRAVLRTHDLINQLENREKQLKVRKMEYNELISSKDRVLEDLKHIMDISDHDKIQNAIKTTIAKIVNVDKNLDLYTLEINELEKSAMDINQLRSLSPRGLKKTVM